MTAFKAAAESRAAARPASSTQNTPSEAGCLAARNPARGTLDALSAQATQGAPCPVQPSSSCFCAQDAHSHGRSHEREGVRFTDPGYFGTLSAHQQASPPLTRTPLPAEGHLLRPSPWQRETDGGDRGTILNISSVPDLDEDAYATLVLHFTWLRKAEERVLLPPDKALLGFPKTPGSWVWKQTKTSGNCLSASFWF